MSRIPRHTIDAVRDATDIVEVVRRHVTLQRKGASWVGLCPFHQEKSPSFNVVPSKGIFHCFGCQAGGDAFRFLMQVEGLSFVEAVKELAQAAGITIEERELTPQQLQSLRQRATLYDVLEEAARFFEGALWTRDAGAEARSYLERRAITPQTAREWRLGWAPGGWTALLDHLHRSGFDEQLAIDAGLARRHEERRSVYDTLRERLIIPIRDDRSRVIAFGGRLLQGDGPKYINTPETSLYSKSKTLYGLETARRGIQRESRCLVVEGYFDVISLHQAGFEIAVATCGTALTPDHLERIRRLTDTVVMLTDADEAGSRAAERSLPLFLQAQILPLRLQLPDAKDPDELVREHGAEAMAKALEDGVEPMVEWLVQRKLDATGHSSAARERVLEDLLPVLHQLPGSLISRVASRLLVPERVLMERVRAWTPPNHSREAEEPTPAPPPSWRPTRDITHLLWLLVHRYGQVADLVGRADPDLLLQAGPIRPVFARLVTGESAVAILDDLSDLAVSRTLSAVVARMELYEETEAALAACHVLERLRRPDRRARLAHLTQRVDKCRRSQDFDSMRIALAEKSDLTRISREMERCLRTGDVAGYAALIEAESARTARRDAS